MKAIAVNIKDEDDFMNDLTEDLNKIWPVKMCRLFGALMYLYIAFWIGSFCYSFCQGKGFMHYITHIDYFSELWPLVLSVMCLCLWGILVKIYFAELNKIDHVKHKFERYYKSLEFKDKLEEVDSFLNFEDTECNLKFNYLTNGCLSSINLSKEYYNWIIDVVNVNDSLLIFDFGENRIYSA